jgi:2-(1,2-epoxy-1,2-dihydrophenyl)acetyl-CoA isomerase
MYYLNPVIDAEEAARLGLVTRTVDDSELMSETMAMAHKIASGPRIAFAYMKRNLHAAETEPMQTSLDMEAIGQARTYTTEDHMEAAKAFVEKRKPMFRGR